MSSSASESLLDLKIQDIKRCEDPLGLRLDQQELLVQARNGLIEAYDNENAVPRNDTYAWANLVDALYWCVDTMRTCNRLSDHFVCFPDQAGFLAPENEELMMRRDALCMRMIALVEGRKIGKPVAWRSALVAVLDNPALTMIRNGLAHDYWEAGHPNVGYVLSKLWEWLHARLEELIEELGWEVRRISMFMRERLVWEKAQ